MLALKDDKDQVRAFIVDHEFKSNGVFQSTRIVVEMALCEAKRDGGLALGELDLSRLMTKAAALFLNGGYSDAIRWDLMKPELRITPLGDVHANFDFIDGIVEPHSLAAKKIQVDSAIKRYPKYLEAAPYVKAEDSTEIDLQFFAAWEEQYGANFDNARAFVEHIENVGHAQESLVINLNRSEFGKFVVEGHELSQDTVSTLFGKLTLKVRDSWRELPTGFAERDLRLWLMRCDLSFIRRPILQMDIGGDPELIVAPAMLRDTIAYCFSNLIDGSFPENQLCPKMKAWEHKIEGERGSEFSTEIAAILEAEGWTVETEIKPTKILHKGLGKDFGDIDVFAWNANKIRIIAMECKDVQFRKTLGEMAQQVADFRAIDRENGKPDYLKRHLMRMDVLNNNVDAVSAYVGFEAKGCIESHLMFRYPVPVEHTLRPMVDKVTVKNAMIIGDIL